MENAKSRVLNFFTSAFVGILGISLLPEVFEEKDMPDKVDDFLLFLLGIFAIFWYRKNASKRSPIPLIILVAGIVIKFAALIIEHDDKEALGDDIGVFIALIIALVVSVFKYRKDAK